jgi:hypothetical protein
VASASAATGILYEDGFTSSDTVTTDIPFDANGPTSCGSTVSSSTTGGGGSGPPTPYRDYAFRNVSGDSDCITVLGVSRCDLGELTVDTSLPLDAVGVLGSDLACANTTDSNHFHSFTAAAGLTFIERVTQVSTSLENGYGMGVEGTDVAPANAVSGRMRLPGSVAVDISASSLLDGTGVQGSLQAASPGSTYSGPVQCLRLSGHDASLVMDITSRTGLAAKWAGAVYWLHQSQDGASDGQRNSLLTQHQLDTTYASCPDPTRPVGGTLKTLPDAGALKVVETNEVPLTTEG